MTALLLTLPEFSVSGGFVDVRRRFFADEGGGRTLINSRCSIDSYGRVCARKQSIARVFDPVKDEIEFKPISSFPTLRVSSASPQPPSLRQQLQQPDDCDDKQDYYVNLGHAIRTLREDYPIIFYKEPGFDIYRDDIIFRDPLNTFAGIDNYKRIFQALRFIGPLLFKSLWVDIVNIWQPAGNTIMIRWTVHGIRRLPWESHGRFDALSVYKLDRKGKIFEHRVDNIARNPPARFKVTAVVELIQSLGSSSTPKPTYFETCVRREAISLSFLSGFLFIGSYFWLVFMFLAGENFLWEF